MALRNEPGCDGSSRSVFMSWARLLLGAEPWRNWATIYAELGWQFSGSGRAVIDIACRRAYLWSLPVGDLYREVFVLGHSVQGLTWAKGSLKLLVDWGIVDWPHWHGSSRESYKTHVKALVAARCSTSWVDTVSKHLLPVPYLSTRISVAADLKLGLQLELPWFSLLLQRSMARLRAGLLCFGHVEGLRSSAKRRNCIFCNVVCLSINFHVLCKCDRWEELRRKVWDQAGLCPVSLEEQVTQLFRMGPGDPGNGAVLALAGSLDRECNRFWAGAAAEYE